MPNRPSVAGSVAQAPHWTEIELVFTATAVPADPYRQVVEVFFHHDSGLCLHRPAFWDGGSTWRVRFASPVAHGTWRWSVRAAGQTGVDGQRGELAATRPDHPQTRHARHGLLRMSANGRGVIHADGTPWLLCADTVWCLPFRATRDEVRAYAGFRSAQGFNAVLLMSVQPDQIRSDQPRPAGWDEGFSDLADGTLRRISPGYFQQLDGLIDELTAHDLVPVWQPLFHGYGWRGGPTFGKTVSSEDVAWYARYLVARYGARPALWLVNGDGPGTHASVAAAGEAVEANDAYAQPTGLHYSPNATDAEHVDAPWADFHWCQTGHEGEHQPEKLAWMWERLPGKAIANGEPTYEEIGRPGRGADWWQGEEAWRNLCAGGTMGVVYGAGSLWQWRHSDAETDQVWCKALGATWRDALRFPGAAHVGRLRQLLDGLPIHAGRPDRGATYGRPGLLAPQRFFICYLYDGGHLAIIDPQVPRPWRAFDASNGALLAEGRLSDGTASITLPTGRPVVVLCRSDAMP